MLHRRLDGLLHRRIEKVRRQFSFRAKVRLHDRPAKRLAHKLGQQHWIARDVSCLAQRFQNTDRVPN